MAVAMPSVANFLILAAPPFESKFTDVHVNKKVVKSDTINKI